MTVLSKTSVSSSIDTGALLLTLRPLNSSSEDVCKAATMTLWSLLSAFIRLKLAINLTGTAGRQATLYSCVT